MEYPSKNSIERLSKALHLRPVSNYMQDWEYEVADSKRLSEFISYYEQNSLNSNEKVTLMTLILASYDDYIKAFGEDLDYSKKIKQFLTYDMELFKNIIEYWSCDEEDLEDCFAVTPLIRQIRNI